MYVLAGRWADDMLIITSFVTFCCLIRGGIQAMDNASTTLLILGSLDDMFQEYAHNSLPTHPRTGVLYNASLPPSSNFTAIQVSIVRLRRDSFWRKGANYSGFLFPPRISFQPFSKARIDLVFSNLGNHYYHNISVPPNYTLVAPVVGFNAYAAAGRQITKLNLTLFGHPILVQFPNISLPQNQNQNPKCLAFYSNGTSEITNMKDHMCTVRDQGHFSVVLPSIPNKEIRGRQLLWKWWVFGFAIGVFGLLFFGFLILMTIKFFRMRKIGKMEKEAEKNEGLDTTNVGQSKMPLATVVRTQPAAIENDYFP